MPPKIKFCFVIAQIVLLCGCASKPPMPPGFKKAAIVAPADQMALADIEATPAPSNHLCLKIVYPANYEIYTWHLQSSFDLVTWSNWPTEYTGAIDTNSSILIDWSFPQEFFRMAGE